MTEAIWEKYVYLGFSLFDSCHIRENGGGV